MNCDCDFHPESPDGSVTDTIVYWQNSGQCCSHLRYTIWLIYLVLMVVFGALILVKMVIEDRKFTEKLGNYNHRGSIDRDRDHTDYSSVGSIRDPFIN